MLEHVGEVGVQGGCIGISEWNFADVDEQKYKGYGIVHNCLFLRSEL